MFLELNSTQILCQFISTLEKEENRILWILKDHYVELQVCSRNKSGCSILHISRADCISFNLEENEIDSVFSVDLDLFFKIFNTHLMDNESIVLYTENDMLEILLEKDTSNLSFKFTIPIIAEAVPVHIPFSENTIYLGVNEIDRIQNVFSSFKTYFTDILLRIQLNSFNLVLWFNSDFFDLKLELKPIQTLSKNNTHIYSSKPVETMMNASLFFEHLEKITSTFKQHPIILHMFDQDVGSIFFEIPLGQHSKILYV